MTKQEIKEAIAKGIAGQGTNVDGGGYLPKILEAIVDAIPSTSPLVVHEFDGPFEDYKDEYNVDDSYFNKLRNAKEIEIEIEVGETVKTITFSMACVVVTGNGVNMLYGFNSNEFDTEQTCEVQMNLGTKYLSISRKSR